MLLLIGTISLSLSDEVMKTKIVLCSKKIVLMFYDKANTFTFTLSLI
jgi:hypothetical protein